MPRFLAALTLVALGGLLAGCGTLGGPGPTAVSAAGSVPVATSGPLSGDIGAALDDEERAKAASAQAEAIATGAPRRWTGRIGYNGYVEPGPASAGAGGTCRELTHTIFIDGRAQRRFATACRSADGRWDLTG